jgi:hypothetical protein
MTTLALKSRDSRSLLADDSGATMVMGIFMAMMVVGMIYYVWGLGGTIIYRERMQDTADAAAFGASVFQARGMNIIAMLNVLMSIFAIIGTACRLLLVFIEATTIADIAACLACIAAVLCAPAAAIFCDPAETHAEEWDSTESMLNQVANICDQVAEGIHALQVVIRDTTVVAAEGYAVSLVRDHYHPPADIGAFYPGSGLTLQSEDDSTTWACHHGGTMMYVRGPALILTLAGEFVLYEPPSVGWIAGEAAVAIVEFAGGHSKSSEHYCNNGNLTFQRVPVDSWLGDEHFQSYSVVYHNGATPYEWTQRGVEAANWGRTGNSAPSILGLDISFATTLHRISFADAEYYYEDSSSGDITHQEWLWHTRWRARLRRFHIGTGSSSGALRSIVGRIEDVIVH